MSCKPKILAFAGSLRKDSYNKVLVKIAAEEARKAGAEVTYLDLADIPLPIYNQDLEKHEGLPENAKKFKDLMLAHHGFFISSPEYNSSITGVLKNAIDWASRSGKGEPSLACFTGKVAGLLSATPGALGGIRGLAAVRSILENIGTLVLPHQVAVPKAHEAFLPDGSLKEERNYHHVQKLAQDLVELASKIHVHEGAQKHAGKY